jgi:hypothetical protein
MLEFLIDNIFCYVWWTCFSTDSRHTYGCKLCSSSRRLVPLFVWGRLHTGANKICLFLAQGICIYVGHSSLWNTVYESIHIYIPDYSHESWKRSFWLTTYLLSLVDVFFNRQSAYLWVQTVLLFSPTCSFIRIRQTSYRGFSKKTKRS